MLKSVYSCPEVIIWRAASATDWTSRPEREPPLCAPIGWSGLCALIGQRVVRRCVEAAPDSNDQSASTLPFTRLPVLSSLNAPSWTNQRSSLVRTLLLICKTATRRTNQLLRFVRTRCLKGPRLCLYACPQHRGSSVKDSAQGSVKF